jgi:hypothetical protein
MKLEENLTHTEQDVWRTFNMFQRLELCSRNSGLPCVEQFAQALKGQHVEMSFVLAVG